MRKHFIFYGYVQGVGFRRRAKKAAQHHNVAGYVRNLDDGTVEMEAEGAEEAIDKMVLDIESSRYIEITDTDVYEMPECGDRGFYID